MKKIITLSAAVAFGLANMAQAETTYRLAQFVDEQGGGAELEKFEYDSSNRLVRQYSNMLVGNLRTDYTYNDKGQVVMEEGWQDKSVSGLDENYEQRYYVEYEYDEQGRVVARKTYNKLGSAPMMFSGMYVWEYDNAGRLAKMLDYTDENRQNLLQEVLYYYNELGQLSYTQDRINNFGTGEDNSRVEYVYDALGRITEIGSGKITDGTYKADRYEFFVYTDEGEEELNPDAVLDETYLTGAGRRTKQKMVKYLYNEDVRSENVIYPVTDIDALFDNSVQYSDYKFMLVERNEYMPDDITGCLVQIINWVYDYDEIEGINGIEAIEKINALGARILPEVNGDVLTLNGVTNASVVSIYDLNGRKVFAGGNNTGNTVNVSSLEKGIYMVTTPEGSAKFVR